MAMPHLLYQVQEPQKRLLMKLEATDGKPLQEKTVRFIQAPSLLLSYPNQKNLSS